MSRLELDFTAWFKELNWGAIQTCRCNVDDLRRTQLVTLVMMIALLMFFLPMSLTT